MMRATILVLVLAALPRGATGAVDRHLGVGSCANSVCHGAVVANPTPAVPLNEYVVWSTRDRHAKAFETLAGDKAKAMALVMGLADASTAKVCLDCHTDNVSSEQRGPTFQLSDGVGCEACHGGASRWIESHAQPGRAHAANLAAGMADMVDPRQRVERCLDCHRGDDSRRATHAMMAAGHPRLSFEIDTFMVLEPYHHRPDEAYARRKTITSPVNNWLIGQAAAAVRMLDILATDAESDAPFPELSSFDCQACHHPMNDHRPRARPELTLLAPGRVRIDDSALVMTRALFGALEPGEGGALLNGIVELHAASQANRRKAGAVAAALAERIERGTARFTVAPVTPTQVIALERALRDLGLQSGVTDYALAEQVVLGLALLCNDAATLSCAKRTVALDALYAATADENRFSAARFRDAIQLWR